MLVFWRMRNLRSRSSLIRTRILKNMLIIVFWLFAIRKCTFTKNGHDRQNCQNFDLTTLSLTRQVQVKEEQTYMCYCIWLLCRQKRNKINFCSNSLKLSRKILFCEKMIRNCGLLNSLFTRSPNFPVSKQ